jgi:hypothetical protein
VLAYRSIRKRLLTRKLSDENEYVRLHGARALGDLSVEQVKQKLADALESEPNLDLRKQIAWGLKELGPTCRGGRSEESPDGGSPNQSSKQSEFPDAHFESPKLGVKHFILWQACTGGILSLTPTFHADSSGVMLVFSGMIGGAAIAGLFIILIKDSSLLSYIGTEEFTKQADIARAATATGLEAYIPLALGYLALTIPLAYVAKLLERRFAYED